MLGPTDDFLARLDRIQRDLEKLPHRFHVVFKIRFDRESECETLVQRNDFPFGMPWTHCEDALNVKGYFIKSVDGLDFFRFKELSHKRADEEEYWAFPSVRDLQVVTGSLSVWYYLPNAQKNVVPAIRESMESTIWHLDEVLRTCRFAPESVQVSLMHCCQMGDWAAMLLYLALRDAHPLLTLRGCSLPCPGYENLRDEPLHPENDLVLRFMPLHVDVVTLLSCFFEVLRQIVQGSLVLPEWDPDSLTDLRHGNVPLDDFVLSDAYGQDTNLDADQSDGGKAEADQLEVFVAPNSTKLRVIVYAETKVVAIDGTPYPLSGSDRITQQLVEFIQALINANGAPVSAADYGIRSRDVECQHDQIKSLIGDDAKPGSGYRIPLEKLMA